MSESPRIATRADEQDIAVLPAYRGRGYSAMLIRQAPCIALRYSPLGRPGGLVAAVMGHSRLHGLRRFLLATSTAHGLYKKYGFTAPAKPQTLMERFVPDANRRVRP